MTTLPITLGPAPTDIGVVLSAAIAVENPTNPTALLGRGLVRLCNSSGRDRIYLVIQELEPGADVPGIPVRVGEWYPEPLQITPDGGIWAWAGSDSTQITALVVGWE